MLLPQRVVTAGLLLAAGLPAQTPDWHRLPAMTSLATKRLGFDNVRERMVMFESSERGGVSRTWEWINDSWSLRRPATTPSPRQGFAAAYDPSRGRFVMFGGAANYYWSWAPNGQLDDTWEYDGINWVQRTPPVSPPPQWGGWLGFDYAAGKLMFCGGQYSPSPGGAWHFDGATWTPSTAVPVSLYGTVFASDPGRARVVALDAISAATREWDGTTWQLITPVQSPPARQLGAMVYVPARSSIVLHGGYQSGSPGTNYLTDLWEWDGTSWAQLSGPPAPGRASHELAHDPTTGAVMLVGGFAANNIGVDTMRWDAAGWHSLDTTLGWEEFASAAFDPSRQTVVVIAENSRLRGLEWDGVRWLPMPLPAAMIACSGIAYDRALTRTIVIGWTPAGLQSWERVGTAWSAPTPAPSLTTSSKLVYHGGRSRAVATCGSGGSLQEWDGLQWNTVPNSNGGPCAVEPPVFDAARNELVVPQYSGNVLLCHIWDGTGWTVRTPVVSPPHRRSFRHLTFGYDEVRQRVVLFGGENATLGTGTNLVQVYDDLWEWDGASWSQRVLPTSPPGRDGAALVFDSNRQQLLLIGGARTENNGAHLHFSDVWALDGIAAANVNLLGPGCGSAAGQPRIVTADPHPGAAAFTVDLYATAAGVPCVFVFGGAGTPVALGAGCTSFVGAPELVAFRLTNAGGFASTMAEIPLAMQGYSFATQAAVLDPLAPLGFVVTQGLQVTVGQ